MKRPSRISRRTALIGVGTSIALPFLEAMRPRHAGADESAFAPIRAAFVYVPNGVHMPDWTPATTGTGFAMPAILEPLRAAKETSWF